MVGDEDRWIQVATRNFTLFSNASDEFAVDIGLSLESLRQVLAGLQPDRTLNSPAPTLIYVFNDRRNFEPFKPRYRGKAANVDGQFLGDEDANLVGLGAVRGDHTHHVVYHEYLHVFTHDNMPNLPTWLDEGLAEYYSTFEFADGRVSGTKALFDFRPSTTRGAGSDNVAFG